VDTSRVLAWGIKRIVAMRSVREGYKFDVVNYLGSFLDRHANGVLVVAKYDPRDVFGQTGYREPRSSNLVARIELNVNKLWVSYDALKYDTKRVGLSTRKIHSLLQHLGVIEGSEKINLGRGTPYNGVMQHCWRFDMKNPLLSGRTMQLVKSLKEVEVAV
jgi:hypothetical protein